MSKKFGVVLALGLILLPVSDARSFSNQKDKEIQMKLALDELKAEVIVLERQVRTMQESLDRNSGQVTALITQIVDNVSAIRQAQSRVAEGSTSALASVTGLGERLALNER